MMAEVKRFGTTDKTPAEYLLFLPLYSPVKQVEIGVAPGSNIAAAPDEYYGKLPIIFYGTSMTQGGCASRTGMCHTSILRRWLDYPVINLGFSGSGKCEMIMSQLLAEIPASIYVIETLQNMTVDQINERVVPFVKDLRKRRPDTPIVLVESPNQETQADKHVALRKAFEKLQAAKVPGVSYHSGEHMYDTLEEPTVDGTHPTDLGFYQMARDYEPFLRDLLKLPKK
jgi:lysophospholipase L1-like esterase